MNTPNPLIPQGTLPTRGRSQVRIAVFTILAIHVVLLGVLLLQGCGRTTTHTETTPVGTNESLLGVWVEPTNLTPVVSYTPPSQTPPPAESERMVTPPVSTSALVTPPTPPVPTNHQPAAGGTTHVVVKGDSFFTLTKKYDVTSKAIADANPGVNSSRLKLGQKLNIPAPNPRRPASTGDPTHRNGPPKMATGGTVYVAKSGDNLTRIAKAHGVSVPKLRAANNLTTDRIIVGQKLVIPGKKVEPVPGLDSTPPAPRF